MHGRAFLAGRRARAGHETRLATVQKSASVQSFYLINICCCSKIGLDPGSVRAVVSRASRIFLYSLGTRPIEEKEGLVNGAG